MFFNKCPIIECFQQNNRLLIPSQSFLLLRSELLLSYQYHHILFDKVQRAPATKGIVRIQVALTIPMSLLGREACSAKASMISESHLHCTKVNCRTFFCKIDRLTVLVKMTVLNSERKNCKERYYTNLPFRLQFPKS